jgi:hypothetical protein
MNAIAIPGGRSGRVLRPAALWICCITACSWGQDSIAPEQTHHEIIHEYKGRTKCPPFIFQ